MFRALHVTNFKSFKKRQTFEFPTEPGLYFMQGVNESEPRLGGNGAGKSTVWDALSWVLYGKTAKGLKAGEVANWDAGRGTVVELDATNDEIGGGVTLVRQWGPIRFFVVMSADESQDISKEDDSFAGVSFLPWLQCILMAQGQPMFLDLSASNQASLFADVLGLDAWLEYADEAGRLATREEDTRHELDRAVGRLQGEIEAMGRQDLKSREDAWQKEHDERVWRLGDQYDMALDNVVSSGDVRDAEAKEAACRGDLQRAIQRQPEAKKCPECGQPVRADTEHVDKARARLDAAIAEMVQIRRSYEQDQRMLDDIEDDIKRIEKEVNPFYDLQRKHESDMAAARAELLDAQYALDDCDRRHSEFSYWARGFKELRLQLIAEALNELEIEVNSACQALGLIDWELHFEVDRETRKGTIARGFNVFVKGPDNATAVPWAAWSGGEAQRLRIAANMGLSDLIRSRLGITIPLEVWDEATHGLSPQGVDDLLEALAYRAKEEQRIIYLVDHRTHSFGGFAGHDTIIKTPSGSRIRQGS